MVKYANNRKIWINLRDASLHPYMLKDAEAFISHAIEAGPVTMFAIATESEAIGGIGLMLGKDVHLSTRTKVFISKTSEVFETSEV